MAKDRPLALFLGPSYPAESVQWTHKQPSSPRCQKITEKCLIQHGVKQCYQAAGYFPLVLLVGKCQSSKNSNGTFGVIFQQYASFLFIVIQAEKDFGFRNDHENNAGETSCSSNPSSSIVVASLLCFLQRSHRKWKI